MRLRDHFEFIIKIGLWLCGGLMLFTIFFVLPLKNGPHVVSIILGFIGFALPVMVQHERLERYPLVSGLLACCSLFLLSGSSLYSAFITKANHGQAIALVRLWWAMSSTPTFLWIVLLPLIGAINRWREQKRRDGCLKDVFGHKYPFTSLYRTKYWWVYTAHMGTHDKLVISYRGRFEITETPVGEFEPRQAEQIRDTVRMKGSAVIKLPRLRVTTTSGAFHIRAQELEQSLGAYDPLREGPVSLKAVVIKDYGLCNAEASFAGSYSIEWPTPDGIYADRRRTIMASLPKEEVDRFDELARAYRKVDELIRGSGIPPVGARF